MVDEISPMIFQAQSSKPTTSYLPQEIIELIIDEVALEGSRPTLQACSLVSKSFLLRSRQHLFAHIDFKINTSHQARADKLLKVLRHKNNGYILPAIRSLKVTYDTYSFQVPLFFREMRLEQAFLKSREMLHNTLRSIGLESDKSLILLELLSYRPLEVFHFTRQYVPSYAAPIVQSIRSPLVRICSSSSLKILHLFDIRQVPKSLFVAALTYARLHELRLSYVIFDGEDPLDLPTASTGDSLALLERLELTYLSYSHIFGLLRSILRLPASPAHIFPRLRTLRISPKAYLDWQEIGEYIVHSMPSLDTLHFLQKRSTLDHMVYQAPYAVPLHQVASLRHLKFIITCYEMGLDLLAKQLALARFFDAKTLPTTIASVVVNLYIELGQYQSLDQRDPLARSQGWTVLDQALSSPTYPDLSKVIFNVKLFYRGPSTEPAWSRPERGLNVSTLVPLLARCRPRVEVEANLESIVDPTGTTLDYIRTYDAD